MRNQDNLACLDVAKKVTEEQIEKILEPGGDVKQLDYWQNKLEYINEHILHIVKNQIPPYAN